MKLLVTGGAGFIGDPISSTASPRRIPDMSSSWSTISPARHRANLAAIEGPRSASCRPISANRAIDPVMAGCDVVVHFAAESHVDRSIEDPGPFLRTNIIGTEVLLRLAMKHRVGRFHHISTDEVFGALPLDGASSTRTTPYAPRSPYSACKAARTIWSGRTATPTACPSRSPTAPTTTARTTCRRRPSRCSSPTPSTGSRSRSTATASQCGTTYLSATTAGPSTRLPPWRARQTYCVGGGAERNGLQLAETILDIMGSAPRLIEFVADRPGHDRRYADRR